jgi:mono/diheme cytochrome c family protein
MRTNPAAFALSIAMGLIVLLIGFLALSLGGLVNVAPAEGEVAEQMLPADSSAARVVAVANSPYPPASSAELASLLWRTPARGSEVAAMASGDALFKNNCAQCHAVNERMVGPALAGISKRRSITWLIPWVKNSSKVVASGDVYAVKLFEENGKQQMPAFPQLSDKDVKDIVLWVSAQEGAASAGVTGAVVAVN